VPNNKLDVRDVAFYDCVKRVTGKDIPSLVTHFSFRPKADNPAPAPQAEMHTAVGRSMRQKSEITCQQYRMLQDQDKSATPA
jgi:hypothetical protein